MSAFPVTGAPDPVDRSTIDGVGKLLGTRFQPVSFLDELPRAAIRDESGRIVSDHEAITDLMRRLDDDRTIGSYKLPVAA